MDFILKMIISAVSVVITAYLLPGVHLTNFWYALLLAALLALLNVSLKPVLVFLTIPATILSLGLFLLVINAFIIMVASWILEPDFNVDGFWWALLFSVLLSVITSVFERLTVKPAHRRDSVQVFDKDGNRIA